MYRFRTHFRYQIRGGETRSDILELLRLERERLKSFGIQF